MRSIDEQPTIHEDVTARTIEAKGFVSDRCELNRQIRRDNALLHEIKAQVRKLTEDLEKLRSEEALVLERLACAGDSGMASK